MHRFSRLLPGLVLAPLLLLTACDDDLPTAAESGLVPDSLTVVLDLPADQFLSEIGEFSGYTGPRDASYLLVADDFDGALEAHTLARFGAFPDSVRFTKDGATQKTADYALVSGTLLANVNRQASSVRDSVVLQFWPLAQEWDAGSVSWQLAVDTAGVTVPWIVPGGTPATSTPIARFVWSPADTTARGDSIAIPLDSVAIRALARPDFKGLLVTADRGPARIQFTGLNLEAKARPAGADTLVNVSVSRGARTFIYTPEPPELEPGHKAGGITSERLLFRLRLPERVACPGTVSASVCATSDSLSLRDASINRIALLMQPVPVPLGFRPLAPAPVAIRSVGVPPVTAAGDTLWALAPLGRLVIPTTLSLEPRLFVGRTAEPVSFELTQYFRDQLREDPDTASRKVSAFALLGELSGGGGGTGSPAFGFAGFTGTPTLRIVYTVPVTPAVP